MLLLMSRYHPFRLASLRRARSFAGFMLLVFLLRVGITMACEPHEFAELFGGPSTLLQVSATADSGDQGELAGHVADHCRQCNCHHGVALPCSLSTTSTLITTTVEAVAIISHANAPPERQLRPPIV